MPNPYDVKVTTRSYPFEKNSYEVQFGQYLDYLAPALASLMVPVSGRLHPTESRPDMTALVPLNSPGEMTNFFPAQRIAICRHFLTVLYWLYNNLILCIATALLRYINSKSNTISK
ncbi:hypothetical protein DSUL_50276 [Desulfovibrionales bacterium]